MATDTDITRERVEKALWDFTGFQGDASAISGLMVILDTYAASQATALANAPAPVVEAHLHTLTHLAEQLMDTGGKLQAPAVVPAAVTPVLLDGARPKEKPAAKSAAPAVRTAARQDAWPVCRTCGVEKKPEDYHKDAKNRRTGYKTQCIGCGKIQDAEKKKRQAAAAA
jgi:hypothetical protein